MPTRMTIAAQNSWLHNSKGHRFTGATHKSGRPGVRATCKSGRARVNSLRKNPRSYEHRGRPGPSGPRNLFELCAGFTLCSSPSNRLRVRWPLGRDRGRLLMGTSPPTQGQMSAIRILSPIVVLRWTLLLQRAEKLQILFSLT